MPSPAARALSAPTLAQHLGALEGPGALHRLLYERLRLLVIDGRLADGTRLPSERDLAAALSISRTTATRAYAGLREAGLIVSRVGSGSVVQVPQTRAITSSLIFSDHDADTIAWTYSTPVGTPGVARAFERAAACLPSLLSTTGYLPDGLPMLRDAIAAHYGARGLPTDADQILITSGAMGAISLIARTLLRPGDRALVEGLCWPHATEAFVAAGARPSFLPPAAHPWDLEAASVLLSRARHRLAHLVPEFHNPTGAVMTAAERADWAELLARHDVVPVIDESLHAVNLDGVDLPPPFAAIDPRALLIGSSSKPYWGGLRVGWIRAPRPWVMPLVQSRMSDDLGTSAFDQVVVAELLAEGGQTAAAVRARLRTGRDHLLDELATHLPEWQATCPAGGLNLWVTLPDRMSSRVVAAAADHGVLLTPGPRFTPGSPAAGERHLRLPFTLTPEALSEAVRRLARAEASLRVDPAAGSDPGATGSSRERCLDLIA